MIDAQRIACRAVLLPLLFAALVSPTLLAASLPDSLDLAPDEIASSRPNANAPTQTETGSPTRNLAFLAQAGDRLSGNISQTGNALEAFILQSGYALEASIEQHGSHNQGLIVQSGSYNPGPN